MANRWIQHVKDFATRTGKSYGCAISDPECKASYIKPPRASSRKTRAGKSPKSIQQRLHERMEKNRINPKPLTDKQLMIKQNLENKLGTFKRAERISGIPSPPEKYKSTKMNSPTNIPRLIKK
jgi:hypothetical protein